MNARKILLPVDILNCPLDAFPLVDRIAPLGSFPKPADEGAG